MLCLSGLDRIDPAGRAKVFYMEKRWPDLKDDPIIRKVSPGTVLAEPAFFSLVETVRHLL